MLMPKLSAYCMLYCTVDTKDSSKDEEKKPPLPCTIIFEDARERLQSKAKSIWSISLTRQGLFVSNKGDTDYGKRKRQVFLGAEPVRTYVATSNIIKTRKWAKYQNKPCFPHHLVNGSLNMTSRRARAPKYSCARSTVTPTPIRPPPKVRRPCTQAKPPALRG